MTPLQRWGSTVGTVIILQWGLVLALAAAAWLVGGFSAARSLFFGGAAVALPNMVLALWLTARVHRTGIAGRAALLMGEVLKLGLIVACLVTIVARYRPELVWLALIVGVVVALKAQWLALWMTRRY
ncbi:MAG TPA: ATP synthase subunit I [Nevskiaceae bacterium]|nr:ATP synthase subunit I [Nevskiaceae bacterium]